MEPDNVLMLHSLQKNHLIIDHLFIAFYVLFQNDLDSNSLAINFRFSNNSVGACAQRSTEFVLRPAKIVSNALCSFPHCGVLLIVAFRLPREFVHHVRDYGCSCQPVIRLVQAWNNLGVAHGHGYAHADGDEYVHEHCPSRTACRRPRPPTRVQNLRMRDGVVIS